METEQIKQIKIKDEPAQPLGIKIIKLIAVVFVLLSLFYIWPNFVHEQIHYIAASMIGIDAVIVFDLASFPATPVMHWSGEITEAGWMFMALLPSVVSIVIITALSLYKRKSLLLHGALGTYLTFDLVINLLRMHEGSDFIMLAGAPMIRFAIIAIIMCVLAYNVMRIKEVESFINMLNFHNEHKV